MALLAFVVALMAAGRKRSGTHGLVQMSHLKCPRCGVEFDYKWVPAASFTSLRLGRSRHLQCPNCHEWSTFNIRDSRVDPKTHYCHLVVGPS